MQFKLDFETGFYDNFDILKEHNMFEKKYKYSTFKFDLQKNKEKFKERVMTTLIAYDNEIPIAWIRFDHEEKNSNQFQYKYIKRKFTALGMFIIYVKPEYRQKGLASKMISMFELELLKYYQCKQGEIDQYIVINGVDLAFDLLEKNLKFFTPSNTFGNFSKNKQDLKGRIQFYSEKIVSESLNSLNLSYN